MSENKSPRILIVKLSAIGDVLMATPATRAIREACPDAFIAWVVEKKACNILQENSYLDEVIVWDRPSGFIPFIRSLAGISREIKKHDFDICIDLQGRLKSGLVTFLSGAGCRIGFADSSEHSSVFYNTKRHSGGHLTAQQRSLDILQEIGVEADDQRMIMPVSDGEREYARRILESDCRAKARKIAFLCATTFPSKHWPRKNWASLAQMAARQLDATPIFLGAHQDIDYLQEIAQDADCGECVIAGKTTLGQAGAILEECDGVAGVDTGLLFMSIALERPTVGIFGPTDMKSYAPEDKFRLLKKDYDCAPCVRHPKCEDFDCMSAITPEEVLHALKEVM